MAKINIKGLKKLEYKMKKKLEYATSDKAMLVDIGERITRDIKAQARQGKRPEDRAGFTALAKSTIERREKLKNSNTPGQFYKKNRPLNFTGQLVESIYFKIANKKPKISIDAKGMHRPYQGKNGKTAGKPIENRELIRIHQKGLGNNPAREIFGVSEKMVETIKIRIISHLRKLLKK